MVENARLRGMGRTGKFRAPKCCGQPLVQIPKIGGIYSRLFLKLLTYGSNQQETELCPAQSQQRDFGRNAEPHGRTHRAQPAIDIYGRHG
jgi:hypothetical protein